MKMPEIYKDSGDISEELIKHREAKGTDTMRTLKANAHQAESLFYDRGYQLSKKVEELAGKNSSSYNMLGTLRWQMDHLVAEKEASQDEAEKKNIEEKILKIEEAILATNRDMETIEDELYANTDEFETKGKMLETPPEKN